MNGAPIMKMPSVLSITMNDGTEQNVFLYCSQPPPPTTACGVFFVLFCFTAVYFSSISAFENEQSYKVMTCAQMCFLFHAKSTVKNRLFSWCGVTNPETTGVSGAFPS